MANDQGHTSTDEIGAAEAADAGLEAQRCAATEESGIALVEKPKSVADGAEPGVEVEVLTDDSAFGKLTLRQQKFVEAYLGVANGNASAAAAIAGFSSPRCYGWALLRRTPEVRAAINERLADDGMAVEEVLARLAEQARGLGSEYYFVEKGRLKLHFDKIVADGKAHLIASVSNSVHGQRIKLVDSQAALLQLARYYGLFYESEETVPAPNPFEGWTLEEVNLYACTGEQPNGRSFNP